MANFTYATLTTAIQNYTEVGTDRFLLLPSRINSLRTLKKEFSGMLILMLIVIMLLQL